MNQTLAKMSSTRISAKPLHLIALMGYGVVGQGLYNILQQDPVSKFHLKGISIRDLQKSRNIQETYFRKTSNELIQNTEIESIIEATDDADFAWKSLLLSSNFGKNFISANKKMVAANLMRIVKIQEHTNAAILYEASTAGAIPIIRTLETYFAEEPIKSLRGIINGSSNYILSKIFQEGKSFEVALKEAIEKGFAESDPTFDINGSDVQSKLIILALHAFGVIANESDVYFCGIQNLSKADIEFAKSKNATIKLIAKAFQNEDEETVMYVIPSLVFESDSLYSINAENNAIEIEGNFSGNHLFSGKGAGAYPTASALISDLHAASNGFKYKYSKYYKKSDKIVSDDHLISVYVRYPDSSDFEEKDFEFIKSTTLTNEGLVVLGEISISTLKTTAVFAGGKAFIMEIPVN